MLYERMIEGSIASICLTTRAFSHVPEIHLRGHMSALKCIPCMSPSKEGAYSEVNSLYISSEVLRRA